ncbi:MAG: hypothetical protein ACFE9R_06265 [Candidatus Hermodarchaeota archaeon]
MDESLKKRTVDSPEQIIKRFKESMKGRITNWTKDEKVELETDKFDTDEPLENSSKLCIDMPHQIIEGDSSEYIEKDFKIIGFDESSYTNSGTYGKIASFKFGECQINYKDGKYKKNLVMYRPIFAYIEDNVHKLIIYRDVIENFVKKLKKEFYHGSLKYNIDDIEDWFENVYKKKINKHIDEHKYYYPSIGHVVDRIRTADEILKTLIRIRDESDWGKNKKVVFLGDGIHMFRQHIFPPKSFTNFFYNFIQTYDIKYFSFSKTSRLRDIQGNFILLYWDDKIKSEPFIVELPELSEYTVSWTYIVRLIEDSASLRFDIPDYYDTTDAKIILKRLIPFSPFGYPLSLSGAHEASSMLPIEKHKFEAEFLTLQHDPETRRFMQVHRHKVIPPK